MVKVRLFFEIFGTNGIFFFVVVWIMTCGHFSLSVDFYLLCSGLYPLIGFICLKQKKCLFVNMIVKIGKNVKFKKIFN